MGDLKPGVRLGPPATYDWSKHASTLVLAVRQECKFCEQSISFYQQLAERERSQVLSAHVLAVSPASEQDTREYARNRRLSFEFVPNVNFEELKVAGTPPLILVDRSGEVPKAWIGKLSGSQQEEVLRAVGATN